MNNKIDTSKKNSIIIFLLWPFFALIYAFRNYKEIWAKDIIWFFVIFYGFTMTVNDTGEVTIDANRYRSKFIDMAAKEVNFSEIVANFYDEEDESLDILETIISFSLSRVTNNPQVLFAVFGLIFGYFYSRNIWYLVDRVNSKISRENIPILFTFAFIVGFWSINGFRFWTATHIFLFGALPFLLERKKKFLWISALSVLMHFSFLFPMAILGIYILAGNRTIFYFILFILTFFIKELDITAIGEFLTSNLPDIFLPKVKTYTNTDYAEGLAENLEKVNWYIQIYGDALKWSVTAFLVVIFFTGKKYLTKHINLKNLFSYTLLLYSLSNIISLVPSGGRFLSLSNLFAVSFIFFYVQYAPKGTAIRRLIIVAIPALALFTIVSIRIAFDTMGVLSMFGNPFLSLIFKLDITLIELVKSAL